MHLSINTQSPSSINPPQQRALHLSTESTHSLPWVDNGVEGLHMHHSGHLLLGEDVCGGGLGDMHLTIVLGHHVVQSLRHHTQVGGAGEDRVDGVERLGGFLLVPEEWRERSCQRYSGILHWVF